MKAIEGVIGAKFSRLTAIERVNGVVWKFLCDCGNEVIAQYKSVRGGNTKSCGCLKRDSTIARNKTHGLTNHPLYTRYAGMIARCENPKHVAYKNYGGKGVKVCA